MYVRADLCPAAVGSFYKVSLFKVAAITSQKILALCNTASLISGRNETLDMFTARQLMKSKRSRHVNAKRTLTPHCKLDFYDAYKIMATYSREPLACLIFGFAHLFQ